jgi:hypothetical protein
MRLVVLHAIPQSMLHYHVRTLAGIARLLNDGQLRDALAAAPSAEAAYGAIQAREGG